MHQYICILLNCVYPSGREWSAPPVDPCRLTTRENSDSTSRSFVTPNTFDFSENGVYQPVRIKGYLSLGVSICRVYFSARELLRRNFQRGRARGISRMECPAFGISLSFFFFFSSRNLKLCPFPVLETNHSIYALPNRLRWSVFIGHSKITDYWVFEFRIEISFSIWCFHTILTRSLRKENYRSFRIKSDIIKYLIIKRSKEALRFFKHFL